LKGERGGDCNAQAIYFRFCGSHFALVLALIASSSPAQEAAPDALLKEVTVEVIAIIKQDQDIQAGT
jgi:hypothetical protein